MRQAISQCATRRARAVAAPGAAVVAWRAMDLGIRGKAALVCAASKGLGKGCALALAREGVAVTIVARTRAPLEATAVEIRAATGATVTAVCADITTAEGRAAALAACPAPDILVTNAAGPPPGDFRNWTRDDWIKALDANMLTPIELIKATVDGMIARRFGRIVNITSGAVKAPIESLGLSNGARSGLTGFVAGLARQTVRHNVTLNNLLPGPFATDRQRALLEAAARAKGRSYEEVLAERAAANPAGRLGDPLEFGQLCAYLCSAQAGYLTGQNILIDGGAYPGTF
jgi:3-oxoacyl-[acyl-carrier protein] reductase